MKTSFWVGLLTICALTAKGAVTGQLWYGVGLGNTVDNVTGHINSDGSNPTVPQRGGGFLRVDVAVDTAAGLYWVIDPTTGPAFGTVSSDPTALNVIEYRLSNNVQVATIKIGDSADQDEVNSMAIDPINHILYVAEWGADQAHSGISKITYNPTTGAMSGGFGSATFLVNNASFNGLDLVRYMSLDLPNHKLYFVDNDNGYSLAPYHPNNSVYVVDTAAANPVPVRLTSTNIVTGGFPPGPGVGQGGGTAATDDPNGLLASVAVNSANQLVYFTSQQFGEFGTNTIQNALWWVNTTGADQIATKVSFPAGAALNFPAEDGGLSFDPVARQLYISDFYQVTPAESRILICQLSADGKSITSVRTNDMVTLTGNASPNDDAAPLGTTFLNLPMPVIATSASFTEGTPITLSSSMTINSPTAGYLKGATISISSGFAAGDVLSATAAGSISVSYNSGTGVLTLTNYDTVANYQQALRSVAFNVPGSNPDNYGASTSRALTWILSDDMPNIPAGSVNTSNSTVTIIAVDNPPTNHVPGTQSTAQNVNLSITGLSVTDVDANPASQNLTTTLTVTNGTLTVLTSVSGGVTAGQVTGNGTASVVLTAPQNAINATLAAANGLVYKSSASISGNDVLTVTTGDNGHTGTGGPLQDQDTVAITVQAPAAFTSATSTNFVVGVLGTFHVSASGSPAPSLTESNTDVLPSGVLFSSATGNLSGTPGAGTGGIYTLHFVAHNGVGSDATQVFTLTVLGPPSVSCPANVQTNAAAGVCALPAITFAASATGFPTPAISYKLNGGVITSPYIFPIGTNTVTSTATNSAGTNTCSFTVTVLPGPAPQLKVVYAGTNTLISWPTNYSCYNLQYNRDLSGNNWSNYAGSIVTNAGYLVATNNPAITNCFFRLSN